MSIDSVTSRVQRVRHELTLRPLQVLRVESISPHFRRIIVGGEALSGFVSASFDDHIKLMLNTESDHPVRRDYTPRYYDAALGELAIEFCLHEAGAASAWAAQATPGQTVTIGGPRGSFIIPTDFTWHLLLGDETALPAIARRLEELPASAKVIVLLQVADIADRRPLNSVADVDLYWSSDDAALLDTLRRLSLPAGEGYAWCAGEARMVASARRILTEEKQHPSAAIRAAAYWKRGSSGHHENLEG
ncbi:siderophore-interacting protein [Undibacterium sp. SXout7W]|uniref:siderophore-interacting protein n=1 Tax=Undibacterium sp. SXout7W TaxID=3413049 RepID=UPI003BF341DD